MKRFVPAAFAVFLCACAAASGRVEVSSAAPSFRAKIVAIAAVKGAKGKGVAIGRELAQRLSDGGFRAAALEESDSVLAGSALGLDIASDPRVLAEIRRATGADAIVFVNLDPSWRSLEVAAIDARTGDAVLRATGRPTGGVFDGPGEIGATAAEALAPIAPQRQRAAAAATSETDEIPVP